MRRPTADTGLLTQSALAGLQAIYRPGYQYAKAGVILLDLQDGCVEQGKLDFDALGPDRSELMAVMDRIHLRYGHATLKLVSAWMAMKADGIHTATDAANSPTEQRWQMKQQHCTQEYMSDCNALPLACAWWPGHRR